MIYWQSQFLTTHQLKWYRFQFVDKGLDLKCPIDDMKNWHSGLCTVLFEELCPREYGTLSMTLTEDEQDSLAERNIVVCKKVRRKQFEINIYYFFHNLVRAWLSLKLQQITNPWSRPIVVLPVKAVWADYNSACPMLTFFVELMGNNMYQANIYFSSSYKATLP